LSTKSLRLRSLRAPIVADDPPVDAVLLECSLDLAPVDVRFVLEAELCRMASASSVHLVELVEDPLERWIAPRWLISPGPSTPVTIFISQVPDLVEAG
jgi:hypothetical protein